MAEQTENSIKVKRPIIQLGAENIVEFRNCVKPPAGHPTPEAEAKLQELKYIFQNIQEQTAILESCAVSADNGSDNVLVWGELPMSGFIKSLPLCRKHDSQTEK